MDDSVLAKKIKRGNKKAFRTIYDRYHKQLFFLAKRYVKDQQLAEDAVQNIFGKLWSKRETLDPSRSIKNFLFTMLKNHLLNVIRDRKREILSGYVQLNEEKKSHKNNIEKKLYFKEFQQILERGIAELSQGQKEVFEMRIFKGLSNAEVADKRSVSVNTVKSQFYEGCQFIRGYLKKHADIG